MSRLRWWKQTAIPGLLAATMTFSFGAVVNADEVTNESNEQVQEKSVAKFTDVENHWAQKDIERMAEKGVINGYPDGTFRPNDPVTQLQAVTIVANVFKQQSDNVLTEGDLYIGDGIPAYAKDAVELAVLNDIIGLEEMKPFGQSSTRMFIVNLLVNALGTSTPAADASKLTFTDIADLSAEERNNLAISVENNLVSGYEDNTFKPANSVTRAQMATFASRLYDKLAADEKDVNDDVERYEIVEGTIKSISLYPRKVTLGTISLDVSDKAEVEINDKSANLEDLKANMEVRAVLQDEKIVEIYAYTANWDGESNDNIVGFDRVVTGTISGVSTNNKEMMVDAKTFEISDNVFIKINGELADFKYLEQGMQVVIIVVKDQVESIYAFSMVEQSPLEFEIEEESDGDDDFEEAKLTGDKVSDITPDLDDGELTIRLNGGSREEIDLKKIDGGQDDGDEVAEELEEAIEDALREKNRVKVTFDDSRDRFIFETDNSPKNEVPSIQFNGDNDVLDALGIDNDTVRGTSSEVSWKIIVESDAQKDETYEIHIEVKDEDIDEKIKFSVDKGDTAEEVAEEIADALEKNSDIESFFEIDADDEEVTLIPDETDVDIEIEIDIK